MSYFTIVGRIDQFLFGMLAGVFYRSYFKPGVSWDIGFFVGLVTACLGAFVFNRAGGWPVSVPWKMVVPTLEGLIWTVVILGYFSFARLLPALVSRWLARLGTISYSMYLLHPIIIDTATHQHWFRDSMGQNPQRAVFMGTSVIIPIVLLISILTYLCIEKPFLEMRGSYKRSVNEP